jgi:hypothetical protein
MLLLYPPALLGVHLGVPQGWLAVPPLLIAVMAMVYAFGCIGHDDIPLEAAH